MSRALHGFLLFGLPLFVFAACGKSKETCQRESADLAAMFKSMDTRAGVATKFVKLVQRDDLPIIAGARGVVLELSAEGVRTSGVSETPVEPEVALEQVLQSWRGEKSPPLLLAIDAATPWRRVRSVLTSLEAKGLDDVGLVFSRKPMESTPPPRSAIDDELDAVEKSDPADRAVKVAELATELVRDCDAVQKLFAGVGGGAPEDKAKIMMDGLPPALVECRCKCDVPSLKSLMHRLLVNRAPTTVIHLRLDATELALPDGALWSVAALKLSEGQAP